MRKLYAYQFPGLPVRRFTEDESPRCETCGTAYRAVSSPAICTYYRRRCECAPKGLVKRLREVDTDRVDYITRRRLGIPVADSC